MVRQAFTSGAGLGWHEHHHDLFHGTERLFKAGYAANLASAWIPALDGVDAKLRRGGTVADVGCGHGASTILLAQAYPDTRSRVRLPPAVHRRGPQTRHRSRRR